MPTFPNATALTSSTVTTGTVFPCSESSARNEITAANLLAGLSILQGSPAVASMTGISWAARVRAQDIAGSDGDAITSFSSIDSNTRTFTGTGTLKTGSNGINSKNVLRFNGSSNTFTTPAGGASLTGDFYAFAVVKWSSLTGYQNVLSWGDSGVNGKRRSMLKFSAAVAPINAYCFIGEFADMKSDTALANSTVYLLEMAFSSTTGISTLWVNGVRIGSAPLLDSTNAYTSLAAYTSTVLRLAANPGGSEFLAGDLAEAAWLGSWPTADQRDVILSYVASQYGLSLSHGGYAGVLGSGTSVGGGGSIYDANGSVVIGGTTPILTGGTGISITKSAGFSVYGTIAAYALNAEHILTNNWTTQNVLSLWNKASGQAWSAITFRRPGSAAGEEMGALGVGAASQFPWSGPNSSTYLEASNFADTSKYGDWRLVQTKPSGGNYKLRKRVRDDTQAIEEYDLTAAEPSVNGPTTGLVCLRGKPVTSVANNGTLNTNITTGSTQVGVVIVKDTTSGKGAIYQLVNATLTAIGTPDAQFTTTFDNASTVNIYNSSGQLVIQNKTGGALNLTASYYGA